MPRFARRPAGQRRLPGPWKHGPVPVVGLIGGIGAGKSQVASGLASRGAVVLDADAIGHALLDQRPARTAVVARFGEEVLEPSGTEGEPDRINRKALGRIVFAEPTSLRALEAILHPRMRSTFEKAIRRVSRRREARLVVLDAAVLLEAGWDDLCDAIVFVEASEKVRMARLSASRGWTAEQLAARESAQWPLRRKRERADHLVLNEGTPEDLDRQLGPLWRQLTCRPEWIPSPEEGGESPGRPGPDASAESPFSPPSRARPASRSGGARSKGSRTRGRRKKR